VAYVGKALLPPKLRKVSRTSHLENWQCSEENKFKLFVHFSAAVKE
jgi:hypothetical protein